MILEMAGSRILAPYVGTSIIVWTTLIGMVMGFLSLGYWFGGKMSDKRAEDKILSGTIFFSALFVALIILINQPLLSLLQKTLHNVYLNSLLATFLLFSVPSFLLGVVSPYAAKLKMSSLDSSGSTIGNLYALSTLGSIVGTFAAGFVLIPFLGTTRVLYFIAIALVATSLIVYGGRFFRLRVVLASLLLIGLCISLYNSLHAKPGKLVDIDTRYSRIWVKPWYAVDNRPVLSLRTDSLAIQSGMFLDKDDELVFRYSKYYRMADFFNPNIKDALVIGGAAYSYPKDFLKKHKDANIDVVEIDPGMTKVAKKYFNLPDDERLKIYHEDGRVFLNKNKKEYGAIYVDAFNSQASVPYQLTTMEAVQRIYDSLTDDGVAMVNVISAIDGRDGKFFRAEYATYKKIFPQVLVFQVYQTDPSKHQNLIMVATKSEWKKELRPDSAELNSYMDTLYRRPIENDVPVLTDDHAPVDYYMMDIG